MAQQSDEVVVKWTNEQGRGTIADLNQRAYYGCQEASNLYESMGIESRMSTWAAGDTLNDGTETKQDQRPTLTKLEIQQLNQVSNDYQVWLDAESYRRPLIEKATGRSTRQR